ncbi:hypothetical protein GCM10023093_07970 [Nemorincola caseinilytica]|uniref:PLC-like phosphodiesterase n=2 Tax=Nemorincola caseinilytica TaxID=2054315 RepID=A0ABP8N949_9BACT
MQLLALLLGAGSHATAGIGGYLNIYNSTPDTITLNVVDPSGWESGDAPTLGISLPPMTGIPQQYIEADYTQATMATITVSGNNISGGFVLSEGVGSYAISGVSASGITIASNITSANFIYVTITDPSESWMTSNTSIRGSTLQNIVIPGAHDAAMATSSNCTAGGSTANTQTQQYSFLQMLLSGIRLFDCRPVIIDNSGTIYLGHYGWVAPLNSYQGCTGATVASLLNQVKTFISQPGSKEVVILEFSHFLDLYANPQNNSYFTPADLSTLMTQIYDSLGSYLYTGNGNFLTTNIGTLTANGAKVIVMFDPEMNVTGNTSQGIQITPSSVYNNFSQTNDVDSMMYGQIGALCDTNNASTYFYLSWTLTQEPEQAAACSGNKTWIQVVLPLLGPLGNGISIAANCLCTPIISLANEANSQLPEFQALAMQKKLPRLPNVLYADMIGLQHYVYCCMLNNITP